MLDLYNAVNYDHIGIIQRSQVAVVLHPCDPPGGRVGNMFAWQAVNPGSIPGQGDT